MLCIQDRDDHKDVLYHKEFHSSFHGKGLKRDVKFKDNFFAHISFTKKKCSESIDLFL